jgi:hypothetical protein
MIKDYAKNKLDFSKEVERWRKVVIAEIHRNTKPKGWLNKLFHLLCTPPAYY